MAVVLFQSLNDNCDVHRPSHTVYLQGGWLPSWTHVYTVSEESTDVLSQSYVHCELPAGIPMKGIAQSNKSVRCR